jgi:hypothetical protein
MAFFLDEDGTIHEADRPQPGWTLLDHDDETDIVASPVALTGPAQTFLQGPDGEVLRSASVSDVGRQSYIQPTLRLSENLNLANFTTGMPNGFNAFAPIITSHLVEPTDGTVGFLRDQGVKALVNHWKISANLQNLAYTIVEPLLKAHGNDLMIYSSYLNPTGMGIIGDSTSKHFTGEAITLFLRSSAGNMYLQAENILSKIRGHYTHAFLYFNDHSWLQIFTNGPYSFYKGNPRNPVLRTFDLATGDSSGGIVPMRGAVANPWAVPDFSPMRTFLKPRSYR